MKKLVLTFLVISTILTQNAYTQSISEWKNVLDTYCEKHFEGCFNWDYIEIVSIDDIHEISSNEVRIEGKVKNTGYFGMEFTRSFKADIKVYSSRYKINFKKEHKTQVQGTYWRNCENTIYF